MQRDPLDFFHAAACGGSASSGRRRTLRVERRQRRGHARGDGADWGVAHLDLSGSRAPPRGSGTNVRPTRTRAMHRAHDARRGDRRSTPPAVDDGPRHRADAPGSIGGRTAARRAPVCRARTARDGFQRDCRIAESETLL